MTRLRSNTISGIPGTSNYQGSIYASGTNAYLRTKTTAPGTDDFTIECWINSDNAAGSNQEGVFVINGDADGFQGGTSNQLRLVQGRYGGGGTNGGLEVDINGTSVGTGNGNDIIQEGTWHHVAVTRASGTVKIWVDGVEKASGSAAGNVTGTTFITGYYDGGYTYQGYMSNFRYRKGTAHYTTTFTPPTGPLERTSDTELIFAQSVNNAADGYSSAIHGGTTDIMQVNGNVTANTSAPTLTTSSSVGVVFDGDITFDSPNYMTLPKGTTTQRGRGRGLLGGSNDGSPFSDNIQYINIQSQGNSVDFGNLSEARSRASSYASSTRGIWGGGASAPTGKTDTIDYITIATNANATDFGNLTVSRRFCSGTSSATRGLTVGGNENPPSSPYPSVDVIDYTTIATTGDATDFGNLLQERSAPAALSSPTRAVFGGGYRYGFNAAATNDITFVTIATTGDSADFGDLTNTRRYLAGVSNNTRGVFGSGSTPGGSNTIDYITIASAGDATDFGDATIANEHRAAMSNSIRGVWAGQGSPAIGNTIDFVTIASTGNAQDFGDIATNMGYTAGCSDSHGGLSE